MKAYRPFTISYDLMALNFH